MTTKIQKLQVGQTIYVQEHERTAKLIPAKVTGFFTVLKNGVKTEYPRWVDENGNFNGGEFSLEVNA